MAVLHLTSALPQDIFTVGVEILGNNLTIMMIRFSSKRMMIIMIYVSGSECIGRCGHMALKGPASSDLASV